MMRIASRLADDVKFSAEYVLDLLKRQVGIHSLQLGIPSFELTQPLELRHPARPYFDFQW